MIQKSERSEHTEYPSIRVKLTFQPEHVGLAWDICIQLAKEMYGLLKKVPHLPKNAYYICPHCALHKHDRVRHLRAKLLLLEPDRGMNMTGTCPEHPQDHNVPTLLLMPVHLGNYCKQYI